MTVLFNREVHMLRYFNSGKVVPPIYENQFLSHFNIFHSYVLGKYKIALPLVERSIVLDPNYQYAFGYRGLLKHTLGWPSSALKDLQKATQSIGTVDLVVAALAGVCHSCLGKSCAIMLYHTIPFLIILNHIKLCYITSCSFNDYFFYFKNTR